VSKKISGADKMEGSQNAAHQNQKKKSSKGTKWIVSHEKNREIVSKSQGEGEEGCGRCLSKMERLPAEEVSTLTR